MAKWFGYTFPFYKGNSLLGTTSKVVPRLENDRLIKNDYKQGLLTIQGERYFRPLFGASIPAFLFEPNDPTSAAQIENNIIEYTRRFEPRIIVSNVVVEQNVNNPNVATVNIFGSFAFDNTN
jgi:phage baseplate assembly protein W